MDKVVWSQYKKEFFEIQYGAYAGGPYPSACIGSAFNAVLTRRPQAGVADEEFKRYGLHTGQLFSRFARQVPKPYVVRTMGDKGDYEL